jgi:hypothetical protein
MLRIPHCLDNRLTVKSNQIFGGTFLFVLWDREINRKRETSARQVLFAASSTLVRQVISCGVHDFYLTVYSFVIFVVCRSYSQFMLKKPSSVA